MAARRGGLRPTWRPAETGCDPLAAASLASKTKIAIPKHRTTTSVNALDSKDMKALQANNCYPNPQNNSQCDSQTLCLRASPARLLSKVNYTKDPTDSARSLASRDAVGLNPALSQLYVSLISCWTKLESIGGLNIKKAHHLHPTTEKTDLCN